MSSLVSAFATGLVFGIGLILAGMTDPGKVIAFLDVTETERRNHGTQVVVGVPAIVEKLHNIF